MKLSTERILTTHVGSLPRSDDLIEGLAMEDRGETIDPDVLNKKISIAVTKVVRDQVEANIDIIGDGEVSKMSYHVYAKHRLTGFQNLAGRGVPGRELPLDIQEFPEMLEKPVGGGGTDLLQSTICAGPVSYSNMEPLKRDISNLKVAATKYKPTDVFMTSASPGCLVNYMPNTFYSSRQQYREALAKAMKVEYETITAAGFVLQLDCPDLAGSRHTDFAGFTEKEFLTEVEKSVDALNEATVNIQPENMRMHICWLNYSGPHTHDISVAKLIKHLCRARPSAILFEGANPRHEHEWEDWKAAKIPDDKVLVPGVIDSTSNFVEHPILVAQRICRYADIVGRDRVLAGVDCGFSTYAGRKEVYPSIVLAKLRTLAEGAEIASSRLW
ncbi:MAG: cobalamin-independent methionine synthase II family protein [Pseudomonadota bacterium]|nr:cobalamin-independent methionine synthase II family protein [Pseudomonadota bacterium]